MQFLLKYVLVALTYTFAFLNYPKSFYTVALQTWQSFEYFALLKTSFKKSFKMSAIYLVKCTLKNYRSASNFIRSSVWNGRYLRCKYKLRNNHELMRTFQTMGQVMLMKTNNICCRTWWKIVHNWWPHSLLPYHIDIEEIHDQNG